MSWNPESVAKALGDEAQVVPGCIMVFRGKHIVVMEVDQNGFRLTEEGAKILGEATSAPAETPAEEPKRRAKKPAVDELPNL